MEGNSIKTSSGGSIGRAVGMITIGGIVIMVAILMTIVGYLSFNALEKRGELEKYNEIGKISGIANTEYTFTYQNLDDARIPIERVLSLPIEARRREDVVQILKDAVKSNSKLIGAGVCFAPNAFDGKDSDMKNALYSDENGRFIPYVSKNGVRILKDYTNNDKVKWYTEVEKQKKMLLLDPYTFTNGKGETVHSVPLSAPLMQKASFLGVIFFDMDMRVFQEDLEKISTPDNYFVMFTHTGEIVAHGLNKDFIGKNVFDLHDYTAEEKENVFKDELFARKRTSLATGKDTLYAYSPIIFTDIDTKWGMLSATDYDYFIGDAKNMLYISIIVAVICTIILAGVLLYFLKKKVSEPISDLEVVLGHVANFDLRAERNAFCRKHLDRDDEVGRMTQSLGVVMKNLRSIVGKITSSSQSVAATSEELTATAQTTAGTAKEVSIAIHNIAEGATSQAQDTQKASDHLNEVLSLSKKNEEIMEVLNKSTGNINDRKEEGSTILSELIEKFNEVQKAAGTVAVVVDETNQSADKIEQSSGMIQSIAAQTNLLALNAAIEAARAGEAGRGFAVVAEEIRKLAEQSSTFTEDISVIIRDLKNKSQEGVDAMQTSGVLVKESSEGLEKTRECFLRIEEAIAEAQNVVKELNTSAEQMTEKHNAIAEVIQTLSAIAEENAATSQEGSASVETQTQALSNIAEASEGLAEIATELQQNVATFKV